MKIEYKIYCHEHAEELKVMAGSMDYEEGIISFELEGSCSQCQSESYEKGIESVLAKGWERKGRYAD